MFSETLTQVTVMMNTALKWRDIRELKKVEYKITKLGKSGKVSLNANITLTFYRKDKT